MSGMSIDFAKVYIIFIKDEKEDYNLHFLAISTQLDNHRKSQKTKAFRDMRDVQNLSGISHGSLMDLS